MPHTRRGGRIGPDQRDHGGKDEHDAAGGAAAEEGEQGGEPRRHDLLGRAGCGRAAGQARPRVTSRPAGAPLAPSPQA